MFFIILILAIPIFLCFWIPYKSGKKKLGIRVSVALLIISLISFLPNFELLNVFIWWFIVAISIVFLAYWIFRYYKKKKVAIILAIALSAFFLYVALSPWIDDWTFTRNNAKNMLNERGFVLNDKIKILSNESGGLRDYYHTFYISVSDSDYTKIKNQIISQHNYKGKKTNDFYPNYQRYEIDDTISWENDFDYIYDITSKKEMDEGTHHCQIQLDKKKNELEYSCDID
ncbi:MAG: hypothetical protein PW786_14945 [Arachidicoccus sp.]|nr:hypothetical protein [Arachidicoccus sp.]